MTVTNLTVPVITGTARQGQQLRTSNGTWDFDLDYLDYAYRWLRCDTNGLNCVAIGGATSPAYTLTASDLGSRIRAEVTAQEYTNPTGTMYTVPGAIDNTGATDVTADLQAWIDSVPNGTSGNWSVLRFTGGTYRVNTMLTISGRSYLTFESSSAVLGGNTELRWHTPVTLSGSSYTGNDSLRLIRFVNCSNIWLQYLTLNGGNASPMPSSGDGFKPWEANVQHMHTLAVVRCTNFNVGFVEVDGSGGGDGINWGNENQGTRSTGVIQDSYIHDAHRCGIALVGSGGLTMQRNRFGRIGFWTIDLEPNTVESGNFNTVIDNNDFESQAGLVSRTAIGAFAGSKDGHGQCEDVTITNNSFINRTAEIRFNTNINGGYPYPLRIKRVTIQGNTVNVSGPQIELRQIDTLTVSGNTFTPIPDPEIGLVSCTNYTVSGSTYSVA